MSYSPKNPDHILTFSGLSFDPTQPNENDIRIEDIAHALSMMTRANGHFKTFYSVAQHSVNCCREAEARGLSKKIQLACLLHDASEAYLSDITRPVKNRLPQYRQFEQNMLDMIFRVFGLGELTEEDLKAVKDIDDAFLCHEFLALYGRAVSPDLPPLEFCPDFSEQNHSFIENKFLTLFKRLTDEEPNGFFIGIDGCRGGWICARINDAALTIHRYPNIQSLIEDNASFDCCLIDIPIGLQSSPAQVRPDSAARSHLCMRASTIFPAPCRQAVYAGTVGEAYDVNERVLGRKFTPLTVGIIPKIREVDTFLQHRQDYKNKLLESHPELCFAQLKGQVLQTRKNTLEGQEERIALLRKYTAVESDEVKALAKQYRCATDDILDAVCLAVSARFVAGGYYQTLPENPQQDDRGLLMQMVLPVVLPY